MQIKLQYLSSRLQRIYNKSKRNISPLSVNVGRELASRPEVGVTGVTHETKHTFQRSLYTFCSDKCKHKE